MVDRLDMLTSFSKIVETKKQLESVFFHKPLYINTVLAALASDSYLCLKGFRGGGKTHLADSMIRLIDSNVTAVQQGYLSAELEDVFVYPDIPKLLHGEYTPVWLNMTTAKVKFIDEFQRLGVGAMSAMFKMLTDGKIQFREQTHGCEDFWFITTMNPTELSDDNLNVHVPEPMYDRFHAVLWIPMCSKRDRHKINEAEIKRKKDAFKPIWSADDLDKLWAETAKIELPVDVHQRIVNITRVIDFCKFADGYDSTTMSTATKMAKCADCQANYLCHRIARAPSTRSQLAWERLARGFAFLRQDTKVTPEDIAISFPMVMWNRITFFDPPANPLATLNEYYELVNKDLNEGQEIVEQIAMLKEKFLQKSYDKVTESVNTKIWLLEDFDELNEYYRHQHERLLKICKDAMKTGDKAKLDKAVELSKLILPPNLADVYKDLESDTHTTKRIKTAVKDKKLDEQ